MPAYRRNYLAGGTYFFTVVANNRRPILTTPLGRKCLRCAMKETQSARPFRVFANALLPDHLHTIWALPPDDHDYSTRWGQIKESFTRLFIAGGGAEGSVSASRLRHRERAIWQRRFWEHTCRDEDDLKRFTDYLQPITCIGSRGSTALSGR